MAVERQRQQRTPAQFGAAATSLSDPNISNSSFATQGVVDRSKGIGYQGIAIGAHGAGIAATQALQLGQDVKEGFALADLESAQEDEINAYMESKKNPQIASDAAIDAATLEKTSQSLWGKLGDGSSIEDIDAVEKLYKDRISTFKRASEQGVMSPDEFAQRTLAVTREAINRNPHMYNEILAHSKKTLGLSGIEDLVAAEKAGKDAASKQFQKRIDAAMQISKENNIPHRYTSTGEFDLAYAEAQNALVQQEKFGAEAISRMTEYQNNTEKLQAAEFIRGPNGIKALNGVLNNTTDILIGMAKSPDNKSDLLLLTRQAVDGIKRQVADRAGPLMHLPGVKDQLTYFNNNADALVSNIEKFSSKEDQVKFLENHSKMIRETSYQELAKKINPENLKVLTQLLSTAGAARLIEANPSVMGKIQDTLGNILSGVSNGLGTDYSIRDGSGRNIISSAVDVLASNAGQGDDSSTNILNQTIETIWSDTKSPKFKEIGDKFRFYDDYMKSLGNQNNKEGFKGLSDVARGKASENLEEYMQLTTKGLQGDLAEVAKRGTEVKMSVLPDGRLNIQTSNPSDTDLLLKKYGIRINEGLRVFSNLTGTDTKRASEAMFQQYDVLKDLTKSKEEGVGNKQEGKPNATNPLNLTIPGKVGKFQSFDNVEEGIRAASVQLDRYFTGKTTGKTLQTVSDIAGLWNNENEKGSSSKKDYVATIVKHSGLDPEAKLDLTNPSVKADLIYGMAKAEGRSLRPSQILAALGNM